MFRLTGLKVAEDADEKREHVSMSTAGLLDLDAEVAEEKPEHLSMDGFVPLDLDSASASCLFDSAATAAFSVPLSQPSLPSGSSSHLPFSIPPPLSPLWIFDDKPDEIAEKLESELGDGEFNDEPNTEKLMSFPLPSIKAISDRSYLIKVRMMQALQYIKEWTKQHIMVQVWAPLRNGDQYVLTTSKQPFVIVPYYDSLLHYRMASLMYRFSVDGNNDGILGLPGRVFSQKFPEWTPNVQYYSSKEFLRLSHALAYNVRGSLALPVFEPSQQSCVGVVELIMTSEIVNYAPEVDKVCRALEAVNLRSSEIFAHHSIEANDERCQAALTEILEILTVVCEAQKLPLAQTWVLCQQGIRAHHDGSRKSNSTFNGSCTGQFCISTTNAAFHVVDAHLRGFRDACSEHHLQKGQGVVGKAFSSRRPCFCSDITMFCKTEYPLVHYAQMFGLGGCLALCFQSFHSENDVYAVEFFLPLGCKGPMNYHALLESIFAMVKQNFQNIKVITGTDVKRLSHEMIEMITYEDHIMKHLQCALPVTNASLEGLNEHESNGNTTYNTPEERMITCNNFEKNTNLSVNGGSVSASNFITNKISGRKRGKAEKIISLEVLQQYFARSIKDAAKSLGVCTTTMKRICRQHGISRWPSRKINKVNRSISKLRQVIESFESSDSTFNLNPLVCPLPAAARPVSLPVHLDRDSVERDEDTPHFKTLEVDTKASEGNMKSPVSQASDSSFRNLGHDACGTDNCFSTNSKLFTSTYKFLEDQNTNPLISTTNIIATEREYRDVDMLIEDSASSKLGSNPPSTSVPESKTCIIKACYKGDIIRFRLANDANYAALNVEISRRLMLDVGTFDVRYLDEDNDWVNLTCDEDLEECLNLSTLHGSSSAIRLSVQDICTHLGSSCESSSKCSVQVCAHCVT